MLSQTEKYDLSQPSASGKAGFESFRNDNKGLYYFHFNDAQGQALLYSQGYTSNKSRDSGLASVKKNMLLKDRLEFHTEGKARFFTVKAGNNQEIARSRFFQSREEMEKAVRHMLGELKEGQSSTVAARQAPVKAPKLEEEPVHKPSKFSFRLDFYKPSLEESLRGRIEYVLNPESRVAFEGIDINKIQAFLYQHLPVDKEVALPGHEIPEETIPENADINILSQGVLSKSPVLSHAASFEVALKVNREKELTGPATFEMQVYAHSLEEGNWVLIGEQEGRLPETGQVVAPAITTTLHPGAYRLIASLKLHEKNGDAKVRGSRLIQIY
ncbi:MAG: YegP family protein [Phaeodactylibacter sp.]|nr:YegP family protein [Phaeodactylibacter sp.]MCB9302223.1 YegP family protein [Lewinellaceae bacterium]